MEKNKQSYKTNHNKRIYLSKNLAVSSAKNGEIKISWVKYFNAAQGKRDHAHPDFSSFEEISYGIF